MTEARALIRVSNMLSNLIRLSKVMFRLAGAIEFDFGQRSRVRAMPHLSVPCWIGTGGGAVIFDLIGCCDDAPTVFTDHLLNGTRGNIGGARHEDEGACKPPIETEVA